MAETGVPSDLTPLKEPLVEALINAWMKRKIEEDTPWTFTEGGCDSGEFRYKHDRFGLDENVYVSYPGGEWKEDWKWQGDPSRDSGYGAGGNPDLVLFDASAIYEQCRTAVDDWVDPWIQSSDPNDLTPTIQKLAGIVDQLYVQSQVGVGVDPNEPKNPGAINTPVPDVRAAVVDMQSDLNSLNGLAIDALEKSYTNDVGLTISGQRAMAAVAAIAVGGEAEAWSRAYGGLATFLDQATHDFNEYADAGTEANDDGATALSVISGTAGAASAATFAFPPAAAALGIISGLAGIGSAFWPETEASAPPVLLALKGSNFDDMWSSFQTKVRGVDLELTDSEGKLRDMCRAVVNSFHSNPDSYSITTRGPNNMAQAGDNLPRFLNTDQDSASIELYAGDSIEIVHHKLKAVAGKVEHVGDHQRSVAGTLGGASTSSGWSRQTLQGGILGVGFDGHQADVEAVVEELTDLLLLESRTAHGVAQHCLDISTGFQLTDGEIEAELNRLESRLDPQGPR